MCTITVTLTDKGGKKYPNVKGYRALHKEIRQRREHCPQTTLKFSAQKKLN